MFNRRHFLSTVAASTAALGLSGLAFGQSAVSERKFIFIFADGGWDPLCVFTPKFGSRYIDMEAGSSAYRVAGHGVGPSSKSRTGEGLLRTLWS